MINEYRYNAERDRIDRYAWNPSFFTAQYDGIEGKRTAVYWACTNNPAHVATIAEKGKEYEDEQVIKIRTMLRDDFAKWLLGGKESLTVSGITIPGTFVARFLIAEACDFGRRDGYAAISQRCREGDLSSFREAFIKGDRKLPEKILESYEKCMPEKDVVRRMDISGTYSVGNDYTIQDLKEEMEAEKEGEER